MRSNTFWTSARALIGVAIVLSLAPASRGDLISSVQAKGIERQKEGAGTTDGAKMTVVLGVQVSKTGGINRKVDLNNGALSAVETMKANEAMDKVKKFSEDVKAIVPDKTASEKRRMLHKQLNADFEDLFAKKTEAMVTRFTPINKPANFSHMIDVERLVGPAQTTQVEFARSQAIIEYDSRAKTTTRFPFAIARVSKDINVVKSQAYAFSVIKDPIDITWNGQPAEVQFEMPADFSMIVPIGAALDSADGAGYGMAYWHSSLSYINDPSPGNDEDEALATSLMDVSIWVASLQGFEPEVYAHVELPGNPSLAMSLEAQIASNLVDDDGMGGFDGVFRFANGVGFDFGFLPIPGIPGRTRLFTQDDALASSETSSVPEPSCAALLALAALAWTPRAPWHASRGRSPAIRYVG